MIIQIGGQRNPLLRVQATSGDQHALAFAKIGFAEIVARKPRMLVAFDECEKKPLHLDAAAVREQPRQHWRWSV
mgnify:CR=1 FL=1